MASVHLGRLRGSVGFSRLVAVKRIHPHLAREPDFVAMFLDEARLASRVRHPNVVSVLDVAVASSEVFLVMEYIVGESLSSLQKQLGQGERVPLAIAVHMLCDVLHGLHAAHEATDERGEPLGIVHRDVSPHNILVGTDGVSRLVDFGVAKAAGRLSATRAGEVKGKLGYMAPEQLRGERVTRMADVYSAGVTLWELLTGRRMIVGDSEAELVLQSLSGNIPPPHQVATDVPERLSLAVARAIAPNPRDRYPTALAFLEQLESLTEPVNARRVGAWVERTAAQRLAERRTIVTRVETETLPRSVPPSAAPTLKREPAPSQKRSLGALGVIAVVVAAAVWTWLHSASRTSPPGASAVGSAPLAAGSAAPALPEAGRSADAANISQPPPSASIGAGVAPAAASAMAAPLPPAPERLIPRTTARPSSLPSAAPTPARTAPVAPAPSTRQVPDDLLGRF